MLGTGSILAFPGSMVGAFIAGVMYLKSGRKLFAAAGEIFGTGILGGLLAFPIAKFVMGNDAAAFYFVVPFLISTVGGSMIGYAILGVMERSQILKKTGI